MVKKLTDYSYLFFKKKKYITLIFLTLIPLPLIIQFCSPFTDGEISTFIEGSIVVSLFCLLPIRIAKPSSLHGKDYNEFSGLFKYNQLSAMITFPILMTIGNVISLIVLLGTKDLVYATIYIGNVVSVISFYRSMIILDKFKNKGSHGGNNDG